MIANLTSNPLSVVLGATLEQIYTCPDVLTTVWPVMREAMRTAGRYRVRLTADPIDIVTLGAAMGAVCTSMLQDHQRGKAWELAGISDAVIELAEHNDLPMAATRALLARVPPPPARSNVEGECDERHHTGQRAAARQPFRGRMGAALRTRARLPSDRLFRLD